MKPYLNTLKIDHKIYIFHSNTFHIDDACYYALLNQLDKDIEKVSEIHYVPDLTDNVLDDSYSDEYFVYLFNYIVDKYFITKDIYVHVLKNNNKQHSTLEMKFNTLVSTTSYNMACKYSSFKKIKFSRTPFLYLSTFGGWNHFRKIDYSTTVPAYLIAIINGNYNIYRIDYLINPGEYEFNWLDKSNKLDRDTLNSYNWIYIIINSSMNFKDFNKMGVYIRKLNISELKYLPLAEFNVIGRDNFLTTRKDK